MFKNTNFNRLLFGYKRDWQIVKAKLREKMRESENENESEMTKWMNEWMNEVKIEICHVTHICTV